MSDPGVPSTVATALLAAKSLGIDRLDAQLLLSHLLDRPRSWLLAHDDTILPAGVLERLMPWLARRADGEPLAYLLGEKEFHGLTLAVSPDVLVPRPDTETLVDWALALLRDTGMVPPWPEAPGVLDLGTGSGAIALSIKHGHPGAQVTALDASPNALKVAIGNATRLGLDIELMHSEWWRNVSGRRFHLAVSNPPYIAGDDQHLAALRHEPRFALTPEGDGLQCLRDIIQEAPDHLLPGGWLLLEHGHDQSRQVTDLLKARGFSFVSTRFDLAGLARCTGGRWI